MTKPVVRKGKVTLTEGQYQLLVTTAAQCDYAEFHGDPACYRAAVSHARAALSAIGEQTAAEESKDEEEE
jgi:hypothetical protein